MRESIARRAALGTGLLVVGAVTVFAAVQQRDTAGMDLLALGERVYREQGCAACHSIAGAGSPRSPLDGVGRRLTASEIRLWIVDPQAMRPGIRKPAFDDLPPEEVEALVAFIQGLR